MPFRFSTLSLPRRQQFEAWRDFHAAIVELSLLDRQGGSFEAEQMVWDLGSLALTSAQLPGAARPRNWRHHAKDPLDHWCLLVEYALPRARDPGTQARRRVGFRSLARPLEGVATASEVLSLYIPRDLLDASTGQLDDLPALLPDEGLTQILADYLESLERRVPSLPPDELPHLLDVTRAMIVACLAPTADRLRMAEKPIAATLLRRACEAVQAGLKVPELGPRHLCSKLGVSRSRLYRLFEPFGGVARYIHRQRLLGAHMALHDVQSPRRIIRIAEEFGFADASGFSRAFKREFGYTPSQAREAACAGASRSPALRRAAVNDMTDLGDLLRRLRG